MVSLADLGIVVYYLWIAVGSVSLGYLVLRVTVPEVRARLPEEKLGASVVLGLISVLVAMVLDGAIYGWGRFMAAQGFLPGMLVLTTVVAFALLKAYVILFPPKFLTVGVPIQKPLSAAEVRALERAAQEEAIEVPKVERI